MNITILVLELNPGSFYDTNLSERETQRSDTMTFTVDSTVDAR